MKRVIGRIKKFRLLRTILLLPEADLFDEIKVIVRGLVNMNNSVVYFWININFFWVFTTFQSLNRDRLLKCLIRWLWGFTAWKVSKYRVFSGPYFPAFGLNTERYRAYFASLRIQSKCRKIRTRKTTHLDNFHAVVVCTDISHWRYHQRKSKLPWEQKFRKSSFHIF